MEWLESWQKALAASVAMAALLLIVVGKAVWAAVGRWRDSVLEAMFRPFAAGRRAEDALKEVLAELRPNGGGSLRDAVGRIEERQIRLSGRVDHVLSSLAENSAMFEVDHDGLCIWVSPSYERLLGQSRDEAVGVGWQTMIHPSDGEAFRNEWRRAVINTQPFAMVVRINISGRGTGVVAEVRARPMRAGIKVIGWQGSIHPQTD